MSNNKFPSINTSGAYSDKSWTYLKASNVSFAVRLFNKMDLSVAYNATSDEIFEQFKSGINGMMSHARKSK